MAHQVFVSYATEDADTASRVCSMFEADDIQCWLAPRDVKAGTDYAAAIMSAIRNSQLVVLLFSAHSNASPYALREIERAVAYGRPVLAVRIDDSHAGASMEYYLHHWIEARGGVEGKRKEIIAAVRRQLAGSSAAAGRARWGRRTWGIAAAAVLVALALGLGLGLGLTRNQASSGTGATDSRIAWTELKPSGALPAARDSPAMVYDPSSGRLIVFGGGVATQNFNDSWAYDPVANAWSELKPSGTLPPARKGAGVVYDPVTHRLIMFGGYGTESPLNDTWAYDSVGNAWTKLEPGGSIPPARGSVTMVYDPVSRRLVLFGGAVNVGAPLGDIWAYDPLANIWTQLVPSGTVAPARGGAAMAYDPISRRLIVFGGFDDTGACLNDTWAFDPTANFWTELDPAGAVPPARSWHSMACDPTSGRLIMFGGQDSAGTSLDDAWAYVSAANTWTELEPVGAQPVARAGQVMVYDSSSNRLIMFGGHASRPFLNETWTCTPGG